MRVLIAPDKFAGTLSAPEAAEAIAEGWRRQAPDDELDLAPVADGGPGFVDCLHAGLGGELLPVVVRGPFADPVPASLLIVGETAYVESAQACGLALTGTERPADATTVGVGELLLAARSAGARRVVIGLGGSGTSDGGAGMLAALGARGGRPLDQGVAGLEGVGEVDLAPARAAVDGLQLLAASDVDNPLTGLFGAVKTYGPQKGFAEAAIARWDGVLTEWAEVVDRRLALQPGAGAAGGLGFGLLALGATREPGIGLVADALRLADRARTADLVITGEGAFDFSSRSGKVPYGVAEIATEALRPCIVLAGRVDVGSREMRALGVESAYSMTELAGAEKALAQPRQTLADLAARVARSWSR